MLDSKDMPGSARPAGATTDAGLDVVGAIVWLWARRAPLAAIVGACIVAGVAYQLLSAPLYSAEVTLLPQADGGATGLLGQVAALGGVDLEGDASLERLYGRILLSDRLLGGAMERAWRYRDEPEPVTMFEIFGMTQASTGAVPSRSDSVRVIKKLREEVVSFSRDERTGYMALRVRVNHDPQFAASLANYLAGELEAFNQEIRGKRTAEQLRFVESRLADAEASLKVAEETVTRFLEQNRAYASSPALSQRHGELAREVAAQTSIWVELRRQVELARIEANKQMVSVTVLDSAAPPVKPTSPGMIAVIVVAAVVGGILALFILVFIEIRRVVAQRHGRVEG